MTYRNRVTLIITVFLAFIIITLAGIIYLETSSTLDEDAKILMETELSRIADNVRSTVELNKLKVGYLARDQKLINLINKESDELGDYLNELLVEENEYGQFYKDIILIDPEGIIIEATSEDAVDLDVSSREYFKIAKVTEGIVVSDALRAKSDQDFVVVFLSPIYNDELIGYIGFALYSEKFTHFIEDITLGETGYFIIVDSKNLILSHKDKTKFNTPFEYSISEKTFIQNNGSNDFFYATKKVDLEGNHWTAVAVMEHGEVVKNSHQLMLYILILGSIFLIIAVFIGIYISNLLIDPIRKLTQIFKKLSSGNKKYDTALVEELGQVANSVIGMETKNIIEVNDLKEALYSMKQYIQSGISKSNYEDIRHYDRYILIVSQRLHMPLVIIKSEIEKLKLTITDHEDNSHILMVEEQYDILEKELFTSTEDLISIDFSQILIKKKIRIEDVINHLLKISQKYITANHRIFSYNTTDMYNEELIVELDMLLLERVWMSFLYNSVYHTELSGEITFKIYMDGHYLRFEIEDDGIGMTLEDIDAIHESLYNEATDKDVSLFNLFMSKKILDAHGLNLGIRSLEEHFTRVWFDIPIE